MEVRRGDGRVISVEIVGDPEGTPVLLCHGLADSRLAAQWLRPAAEQLRLRLIAPDRPGTGGTDRHELGQVADWVPDAMLVLDSLGVQAAAVLGISGGGPFAAACAARIPGRIRRLMLVAALGLPEWPNGGMATGERFALELARQAPGISSWSMERLAALARYRPDLFLRLAASAQPKADIQALRAPAMRESFLASYVEAFRRGSWGVGQDLRLLTRPWGIELGSIRVPTHVHHGDADMTVPVQHARRYADAIPGAQLQVYPGEGHFSILSRPEDVLAALTG
jgi:pimeloyl-ACP methyl ester carboxylesterase